jgi:hypothetical protein
MLPEDVLREIRFRIHQGFDNRESTFEWVAENCELDAGTEEETLREAIEQAFAEREREMQSWPQRTDNDRLREAFDALDAQGIVSAESPGLTQDDSLPMIGDEAIVRDEVRAHGGHGYCFFTWNDMARAIDGEGLSLAYGTFSDEDPESRSRAVGETVMNACQAAGLKPEWDGDTSSYIELPDFRWQRRLVRSPESHVRDFLESWELEVRAGSTAADMHEVLEERARDWFEKYADFGPELLHRLHVHTAGLLEAKQRSEADWSDATMNDRIAGAFADLRERGVFAAESLGLTIQDGWGYAGVRAESDARGAVFFHHEDVIDGVGGHGLMLAFGALPVPRENDAACADLAREVVAVLAEHAVPASWSGSVSERIRIAPFEWKKRRYTEAPAYARATASANAPVKAPAPANHVVEERAAGIVVRALRDENGFDLPRSRKLRAAWKAHGHAGEAHAGHLGIPHVFVRAGAHTSLIPRLAIANLTAEKNEVFLRGANATKS